MCMHPDMGHIGNWAKRIINADERACDNYMNQSNKLVLEE